MSIMLYVYATSPYAAKVAAVLHYKRLPFSVVHVDPVRKRELAFAPRKVVPTLRMDGEWRQESTDICLWLDECFPARPVVCDNGPARERALALDRWVSEQVFPAFFRELVAHDGSYLRWLKDRYRYGATLSASRKLPLPVRLLYPWAVQYTGFVRAHARAADADEPLEEMRERLVSEFVAQLGEHAFLGGATPTLADLALFPTVVMPWLIGLERIEPWLENTTVQHWAMRVAQQLPEHPFLFPQDQCRRSLSELA